MLTFGIVTLLVSKKRRACVSSPLNHTVVINFLVTTPHLWYHSRVRCFLERRHIMTARILVVNDTQEILELFRIFLEEEEGYEVVLAGFPMQHIKEVEQINPDLIILDLVFSDEKTGLQMLQMLKM